MFIAMNRFKIALGSEKAFEDVWASRDSHLKDVPGFEEFHLVRGPQKEDHTLYASHTVWSSETDFENWTKSEAFRAAHKNAGDNSTLYLGHPEFEGFTVVLTTTV
ncbi:MAG: antibiotic biosynthesis monooxygenase [Pseudomonadota bacterium]